jgi:CubicO group peptidase (beta-lactamase class C family)
MLLPTLAIGFAPSTPDPGALRGKLQQVVDQQALAWNASFSLGLVWGAAAASVAVAGGLSDHTTRTVVTPSTRYPLGSATKLHTAIACLQAAEHGLLDLDAPIARYVDPFLKRTNGTTLLQLYKNDANISAITTRQALAMRSGVHDYDDAAVQAWSFDRANEGRDLSPYDYLNADDLTPKAFTFAPGGGGAYSSIGYALAGLALAAVSGAKDWFDLDQRSVVPEALLPSLPGYQFAGRGPCSQYADVVEQYAVRAAVVQESADWVTVSPTDVTWARC